DLATQSANDTNSADDRKAINAELDELNKELGNIMTNTSFGGDKMFGAGGKLSADMNFQIGASTGEGMTVNLGTQLTGVSGGMGGITTAITTLSGTGNAANAKALMTSLETGLKAVGEMRSGLGANINRLGHTAANLANMKDNTELALGNIQDADFASEASSMTRNQMLAQTSMSMLKQSNSMSGMVMSLLG
ncbi:flagellin, partial [Cedecea sp. S5-13]